MVYLGTTINLEELSTCRIEAATIPFKLDKQDYNRQEAYYLFKIKSPKFPHISLTQKDN